MKPRLSTVALAVLVQAGLALAPAQAQAQAQQSSESTPAAHASEPSLARQSIEWSQTRLTELDAAIAVFEQDLAKRKGDTRAKAEVALQELKGKRDVYRAEAEAAAAQAKSRSEQELAQAKQSLDDSWTALQGTKDLYLDTVQADVATRRAVLQAEFDARQKAWQEAIDGLSADAARLSAEQRVAIEVRIEALKVRVEEEKARAARLRDASAQAWESAKQSYAEAQQNFAQTYSSIRESIAEAAKK